MQKKRRKGGKERGKERRTFQKRGQEEPWRWWLQWTDICWRQWCRFLEWRLFYLGLHNSQLWSVPKSCKHTELCFWLLFPENPSSSLSLLCFHVCGVINGFFFLFLGVLVKPMTTIWQDGLSGLMCVLHTSKLCSDFFFFFRCAKLAGHMVFWSKPNLTQGAFI